MSPHAQLGRRVLCGALLVLATGVMAAAPDTPSVLACDAVEGIAVVKSGSAEQALLKGDPVASGDWRLTQVASDSAVFTAVRVPGTSVRVFLDSSGRAPVLITERPPPAPPAVALDIQRVRAKSAPSEAQ